MPFHTPRIAWFALLALVLVPSGFGGLRGSESDGVDFTRDVFPILQTYCVGCHTEGDANGSLAMESFADLARGGETGPAFTPGVPESSRMLLMVSGKLEPVMPPDDMEGPNEDELEILRLWIEQGAAGPEGDGPIPRTLRIPKIAPAAKEASPVTALALSSDGTTMALARFGTVELHRLSDEGRWDDSGKPYAILEEQPGKVNDLRFDERGERLVVASGITGLYGRAALYDTGDGTLVAEFVGHRDTLYAAALAPDRQVLATAGYDHSIQLWAVDSGEPLRTLGGHNGAIFDLAFSPDGAVLASASADETVKLYRVEDGARLDTLSQPQGEVASVAFSPDGRFIVAGSADNRLRVWQFTSRESPSINPLRETRFADETPLLRLAFTPDGTRLVVTSEGGKVRTFDTASWNPLETTGSAEEVPADLAISADGHRAVVSWMDGSVQWFDLPSAADASERTPSSEGVRPVYLQVESIAELSEVTGSDSPETAMPLPRGATVSGVISAPGEEDWFRFRARRGEVWMIETHAAADKSPLDTVVEVLSDAGEPITRVRLQALRDSYFTFRGKDSRQSNDFRLFAWEEMELDDYLYADGEVTRLWMYPRGPDSGFLTYPGNGDRWTYFDTTSVTHALQAPCYVVRPLGPDESPLANGLPVFELTYINDDDPMRRAGTDSRLLFTAPQDGEYTIRLRDTRGQGGEDYRYRLTLRPANPDYRPSVTKIDKPIAPGTGREFTVRVDRLDGFEGRVEFEVIDLPEGLHTSGPVEIEAGQNNAVGILYADADAAPLTSPATPRLVARAEILGRVVERSAGELGSVAVTADTPAVRIQVKPRRDASPDETVVAEAAEGDGGERLTFRIRPGETISARLELERNSHDGVVSFGNEFAGRNLPFGVFVDNIGLNGLLLLEGGTDREFFITAAPVAAPQRRVFHLKAEVDGGITSLPIGLEVVDEP